MTDAVTYLKHLSYEMDQTMRFDTAKELRRIVSMPLQYGHSSSIT